MKLTRLLPLLLLLIDACIDRYELPDHVSVKHLVIDGMITSLPGPYTIELSVASDLNTNLNSRVPVGLATVKIADDLGTEETLTEVAPGIYKTKADGIQGVVGRKYYTTIIVGDRKYQSDPQEMLPAGSITNVEYGFEIDAINQNDLSAPQDVLDVRIDAQGVEGKPNLFRWRWSSIHEVKTYPELKTKEAGKPPVVMPAPLECSGYEPGPGGTIKRVGLCTCCNCWVPEYSSSALISENASVSSDAFKSVLVARVPVDHWRFSVRYLMLIEQFSLSAEAYQFWKLIRSQQQGEGSLFQPNSVRVKGNVRNVDDSNETVLGFFGVSAVAQKEFFITQEQVPSEVEIKRDSVKGSCLGQFPGSSNQKPIFW